jgi:hypothetical protein
LRPPQRQGPSCECATESQIPGSGQRGLGGLGLGLPVKELTATLEPRADTRLGTIKRRASRTRW